VSAFLVLAPFDGDDDPEPHPSLVASQKPDTAAFMKAAVTLGVLPPCSYLLGDGWFQTGEMP